MGIVFGAKGTSAILSVEYFCCDRPNPILQVCNETSCSICDLLCCRRLGDNWVLIACSWGLWYVGHIKRETFRELG